MEAKNIRIITAAVCSIGIVVMALYTRLDDVGFFANVLQSAEEIKAVPTVETVTQKLSDSWKSSLASYNTINPTQEEGNAASSSKEADTLTNAFAKSIFEQYLRGKQVGLYTTAEDKQAFIESSVKNITASLEDTQIILSDIEENISTTVTAEDYIESVAQSIQTHSIKNDHELSIFSRALEAQDPEIIAQLEPIAMVYTNILADLLKMPVPAEFAEEHIALANAMQSIAISITGMRQLYVDPMLATVRFGTYVPATENLKVAIKAIQTKGQSAVFSEGSAGHRFMNILP